MNNRSYGSSRNKLLVDLDYINAEVLLGILTKCIRHIGIAMVRMLYWATYQMSPVEEGSGPCFQRCCSNFCTILSSFHHHQLGLKKPRWTNLLLFHSRWWGLRAAVKCALMEKKTHPMHSAAQLGAWRVTKSKEQSIFPQADCRWDSRF